MAGVQGSGNHRFGVKAVIELLARIGTLKYTQHAVGTVTCVPARLRASPRVAIEMHAWRVSMQGKTKVTHD